MAEKKLSYQEELDMIKKDLWTTFPSPESYHNDIQMRQNHLLEQYKMYVEMADRISSRRNLANVFFLSLHTSILAGIGFTLKELDIVLLKGAIPFVLCCVLLLCLVWWWLIRSYKNLNSAKYKVIGLMEEQLPAQAYVSAEWKALGRGKDYRKYLPFTMIEQWIPVAFVALYVFLGSIVMG